MSVAELMEWVAYTKLQDPKEKQDIELSIAQSKDDSSKTKELFDFLKQFGGTKNVGK